MSPFPLSFANTVIDECESTNDLARQLAEAGAPHGTWVSARRQGSGRGRLGRKWESIDGNLFLSLIVRFRPSANWSWIPMATAVAVAECLRDFNPRLTTEIKWPNDLWLERRKLGGILCEAFGGKNESFIVIGIGLNCVHAPQGLDQETISLGGVSADELRMPLVSAVLSVLEDLQTQGSDALLPRYAGFAALRPGTPIEWVSSGALSTGTVEGMGSAGELLVRGSDGILTKLFAEDVKVRLK